MKVPITQLREGCILSDDVTSLTNKPLIPKKTIINKQHIQLLQAFLINEIQVESTLVNGKPFRPYESHDDELENDENANISFTAHYLKSVQEYKKIFQDWQSGSQVDIVKVRKFFIPLLERSLRSGSEIFTLHHYSTKEDYLFHHSVTVGLLSGFLGKKQNYEKGQWLQIAIAGLLSDCGMAKVSPKILDKQTALLPEEYNEIRYHPTHGYKMLQNLPVIREGVKLGVFQHHERTDGSGYPLGISGEKIHPYGKIIAVADVYHAMTSERAYRSKQSPFKVLEMILQDSFGQFDIQVIQALTSGLANFSIGTKVRLSDGQIGEIVFVESKSPTRPMVKLEDRNEFIQLSNRLDLFIEEIITE
ncbi:HD-GYP domain-containing protein [Bacillus suaedaesalsae]|uniref:HD-GYP domain-containing protein n=1 Tax=Bacillus suaedaesalsae TaxID=2810349 RepID=A0ABS2DEP7_9BACI|nr:HD-GYP domain-containing protein [Bacillus suaedaesalsae]MBM6616944.1 HD-GYP domain-containing protein [Bacillus suaedaesalsae]